MHDMAESEALALNKTVRRAIRLSHGLHIHLPVSGGAVHNTALGPQRPTSVNAAADCVPPQSIPQMKDAGAAAVNIVLA